MLGDIKLDSPEQLVDATIAWYYPASQADVDRVLSSEVGTGDGRSEWTWLRLANGDLMLGVFPQGDTYEEVAFDREERRQT